MSSLDSERTSELDSLALEGGQMPEETIQEQEIEASSMEAAGQEPQSQPQKQQQPQTAPTVVQKATEAETARQNQMFSAEYVRELRQEAARYRTKTNELEQRLAEALKQIDEMRASTRQAQLLSEATRLAQKLRIVDPDAAIRLIDQSRIEFDGDRPRNLEQLLQELIEQRPYLRQGLSVRAANPSNSPASVNEAVDAIFEKSRLKNLIKF
jgi:hypothetical protein